MDIEGYWYPADNSSRQSATFRFREQTYQLIIGADVIREGKISDLVISKRVGDTIRRIQLTDDSLFESSQNNAIDTALAQNPEKSASLGILHKLENRWTWVISALLITVLVAYASIRYGVPAASEKIASQLPESFNQSVSDQALTSLDQAFFTPSELDAEKRAEIQYQFDALVAKLSYEDIEFELHFRRFHDIPNAMALPSGDIVVTDKLVEVIEHPQELDSILLHEIAHVVAHDGMTQVIRASTISVIAALALGDVGAMGDVAVGIPIFMMQNSYSQNAESEADKYAFARMKEMGKDPKYFADIISRLGDITAEEAKTGSSGNKNYFSSHPNTLVRAQKAIEASNK